MDKAILNCGVNLIDTAEQYPIPSDGKKGVFEGDTERQIGEWMASRKVNKGEARNRVVIATKITGGRNINPTNIRKDCDGSLSRLQLDYIDIYQLHWPARYSPQSNWGQSLSYNLEADKSPYWRTQGGPTTFDEICISMQSLIDNGKIRGWGLCNDNAYGLTGCTQSAKALGVTSPCSIQGDFSLIDRKSEENGVAEAASPYNENVGFMAYNALAGGMLTGKYINKPAAIDNVDREIVIEMMKNPRGRMDDYGWSQTLYRYRSDAALSAIKEYEGIAKHAGMSLTELSLRWCRQRSLITTTLVGHTNMDQLQQSIDYFTQGKELGKDIMWEIDRVHMKNRLPIFSSNRVGKDWDGEGEIGERIP
jgi:aryl-alcohol dehydrogenase-like predicted oxidoreductase